MDALVRRGCHRGNCHIFPTPSMCQSHRYANAKMPILKSYRLADNTAVPTPPHHSQRQDVDPPVVPAGWSYCCANAAPPLTTSRCQSHHRADCPLNIYPVWFYSHRANNAGRSGLVPELSYSSTCFCITSKASCNTRTSS